MSEVKSANHAARSHSLCSASASERWLECPGSVLLSMQVPEPPTSPAALEGTVAHELSEKILGHWLKNNLQFDDRFLDKIEKETPEEMFSNVMQYVYCCTGEVAAFDSRPTIKIEQRLIFSDDMKMFGTADFIATGMMEGISTGVIVDLKYGKGKKVKTEENSQLAYYAVALKLCSKKNLERIKVRVVQPRVGELDGSQWFSAEALDHWKLKLMLGAENALMMAGKLREPKFKEGGWCWFCPGKGICPEVERTMHAKLADAFPDDLSGLPEAAEPRAAEFPDDL